MNIVLQLGGCSLLIPWNVQLKAPTYLFNNEVEYLDHEHLSTEYTPHGLWDEFGYRIKVVPMDLDSEFYISRTLENY